MKKNRRTKLISFDKILIAYLQCPVKASLIQQAVKGHKNYMLEINSEIIKRNKAIYFSKTDRKKIISYNSQLLNLNDNFYNKYDLVTDLLFTNSLNSGIIDAIEIAHDYSSKNLTLIYFAPQQKASLFQKYVITYLAILFELNTGHCINTAKIIGGIGYQTYKFKITKTLRKKTSYICKEIEGLKIENTSQQLIWNRHCEICEYKQRCSDEVNKTDNISKIKTLKRKEIVELANKGIFTARQYSFTFRPRKQLKKVRKVVERHFPSLKALAIREKKIFIYKRPVMTSGITNIFIDVEGDPDRNLFYLISILIVNSSGLTNHSFWINDESDTTIRLNEFVNTIKKYNKIKIFHYGSYENKFFKFLEKKIKSSTINRIKEQSVNVLSLIYNSIYFPTYSNGLKEIANFLGFNWSEPDLTGLKSIYLRREWELTSINSIKERLITYNIEDCLALKKLVDFIFLIINGNNEELCTYNISDDINSVVFKDKGKFDRLNNKNYLVEHYESIVKCAYFDYQRDKVYFRSDKNHIPQKPKNTIVFSKKVNKEIKIRKTSHCIRCKSRDLRIHNRENSKIIIDIVFFNGGIRKCITKHTANYQTCRSCGKTFFPPKYKSIKSKYGHNLMAWVIYQNIVNGISFEKIEKTLGDTFQISIGKYGARNTYVFKVQAAEYYFKAYRKIILSMKNWHVLHVDETRVRVSGLPGYIWIFTSLKEVFYIYTEKRKTDFINDLLKDFKGVLVSDFYKGYEGLKCKQQKCLVHLLRDINDDLFKYQQDEDLRKISNSFSVLMQGILKTIDRYGLRKRNLNKHRKDVTIFYSELQRLDLNTDIAIKLRERFEKNRDVLFTFLECDDVPWNNNNAEHGIKHFANYRRGVNGVFTETGLKRYLILLSIYETCNYSNINFLKFLQSKEKYIHVYERKYTKSGYLRKGCEKHRELQG